MLYAAHDDRQLETLQGIKVVHICPEADTNGSHNCSTVRSQPPDEEDEEEEGENYVTHSLISECRILCKADQPHSALQSSCRNNTHWLYFSILKLAKK